MPSLLGQDKVSWPHCVFRRHCNWSRENECVKDWPVPQVLDQLQSFLGFVGYYRRFIKVFSKISRPLYDMFKGSGCNKKKKHRKPKSGPFQWQECHQTAFAKLVNMCCEGPILAYADYTKPFTVHTDASLDGLGAVLYQCQEGKDRVIAYAIRGLSQSERNYPAHKLEFSALKWAVTDKFHDYLYGNSSTVKTDNNPLTYVLTSAKLDATGQRWVANLSEYNFDIIYRSGPSNRDADALSRISWPQNLQQVSQPVVHAMCQNVATDSCAVKSCAFGDAVVPDWFESIDYLTLESSKGGFENILVVTDHFTKYSQVYPMRNQTARTTAQALYHNFFVHYGFPAHLHSDQGSGKKYRLDRWFSLSLSIYIYIRLKVFYKNVAVCISYHSIYSQSQNTNRIFSLLVEVDLCFTEANTKIPDIAVFKMNRSQNLIKSYSLTATHLSAYQQVIISVNIVLKT